MRAFVIVLLSASSASAGGFDRFQRDESLLFDAAGIVVDLSAGYTFAAGAYDSVDGRSEQVDIGDDVWGAALRIKVSGAHSVACLASVTQPFGTDLYFGDSWSRADVSVSQRLRVTEYSATCSYALNLATGVLAPLAGLAYDELHFRQSREFSHGTVDRALDLESGSLSWRAGLGYRHSASGISTSLVYYSAVSFDVDGQLKTPNVLTGSGLLVAPVRGTATFPQSVRLDVVVPLAPNWLLSFAGQWSDWSTLDEVPILASSTTSFWSLGTQLLNLETHFRDGLTASVLLGHAWNTDWASWTRVSWDRATTTGWTEHSESWAVQIGTRYKFSDNIELSAALTGIWSDDVVLDERSDGAPYAADYEGELVVVPQLGVTSRF